MLQVKMRDVLGLVSSVLCANCLALGLSQAVPSVLQQHMDEMQRAVVHELAPNPSCDAAAALSGTVSRARTAC